MPENERTSMYVTKTAGRQMEILHRAMPGLRKWYILETVLQEAIERRGLAVKADSEPVSASERID